VGEQEEKVKTRRCLGKRTGKSVPRKERKENLLMEKPSITSPRVQAQCKVKRKMRRLMSIGRKPVHKLAS